MSIQKYNVYDIYLQKYKKFILVLSYTPGLDITNIIDDMIQTFKFKLFKIDSLDLLNIDYSKINNDVQHYINNCDNCGILITGINFPSKSLNFRCDLHLHFNLSLTLFLKTGVGTESEYYTLKKSLTENSINKYFNIKGEVSNDINDSVFDKIIDFIEFKVYGKNYSIYSTKSSKSPIQQHDKNKENDKDSSLQSSTDSSDINEHDELDELIESNDLSSDNY